MRWQENSIADRFGEVRKRIVFLFWPRQVGKEWRWLEFSMLTEKVTWKGDGLAWQLVGFENEVE